MKCPGQDRRYWIDGAVVEVPCPECGYSVEIFRDESLGKCSKCGHKFENPGKEIGCAKWCGMANECLGIITKLGSESNSGECALAARLIQWVEQEFRDSPNFIVHVLKLYQYAKELVRKEGGNPRVVLCAALLLAVGLHTSEAVESKPEQSNRLSNAKEKVNEALQHLKLDEETSRMVCQILESYESGKAIDTIEYQIVCDSQTLAKMAVQPFVDDPSGWENVIQAGLRTQAAKEKAHNLFHA